MTQLLEFRKLLLQNIIDAPSAGDFISDEDAFYKAIGVHNGKVEILELLDKYIDSELNNMAAGK